MTEQALIVDYQRSGGRPPSDDERLAIEVGGRFHGRRTVAGPRVGTFEGQLEDERVELLSRLSADASAAGDLLVPVPPDGAAEWTQVQEHEARMGSNARPEGPWGVLTEELRRLLDERLVAAPAAALELQVLPAGARLSRLGEGELEIDEASITTRTVRLDADGLVLGRGGASASPASLEDAGPSRSRRWSRVASGWALMLEMGQPLELGDGDWLQVWVAVRLREPDGTARDARLFVARQA